MDTLDSNTSIFELTAYTTDKQDAWDTFVRSSRNGTFLAERAYMDYHSDRFRCASIMAYRNGKLTAVLPACRLEDNTLSSHAGLTYGGWILPQAHMDGAMLLQLFNEWIDFCRAQNYKAIDYKPIPHIYTGAPSQEDLYALWRCGFSLSGVTLSSAIDLRNDWKFNMSKRQQVRKALTHNVVCAESTDYASFWTILNDCLAERHQAKPVHSLDEITMLADRFPANIKLHTLSDDEGVQAGVCIYDTGRVAHSQYAATTAKARKRYYLAALYHHLLTEVYNKRDYFDFGTSNENGGHILNTGLLNQKYSMGGSGIVYQRFTLALK